MVIHPVFDLLAWLSAALLGVVVARVHLLGPVKKRTPFTDPGYFIALGLGALFGAILIGSLNLNLAGRFVLGHSIAGAIIGGTAPVVAFKLKQGISASPALVFVGPLSNCNTVGSKLGFLVWVPTYHYTPATDKPSALD